MKALTSCETHYLLEDFDNYKHVLTETEQIGYPLEVVTIAALDTLELKHKSNPLDPIQWKKYVGVGVDHHLESVLLEDKNYSGHYVITPSIFKEEFLSRFLKSDPLHVRKWVTIISYANFSPGTWLLIRFHRITVLILGFQVRENNLQVAIKKIASKLACLFGIDFIKLIKRTKIYYEIFLQKQFYLNYSTLDNIQQKDKRRKNQLLFNNFSNLVADLLFIEPISSLKLGGEIMKKQNRGSDYPLEYYCEQCLRYKKGCEKIEEHEINRFTLYCYSDEPKYRQTTLFSSVKAKEENAIGLIPLLNEFNRTLDVALKCLRKRNYLHRLYLRGKLGYPCFS